MTKPTVRYNGQDVEVPLRMVCAAVRKELRAISRAALAANLKITAPYKDLLKKRADIILRDRILELRRQKSIGEVFYALSDTVEIRAAVEAEEYTADMNLVWSEQDAERYGEIDSNEELIVSADNFQLRQARCIIDIKQVADQELKFLLKSTEIVSDNYDNGQADVSTEFWQEQDISPRGWPAIVKTFLNSD